MRVLLFYSYLALLTPSLVTGQSSQTQNSPIKNGPTINQDRVVDYAYCYEALGRWDLNGNNKITKSEYLDFCQDFGQNTECLAQLDYLPIQLQAVWNELSCACATSEGFDCCVGPNANFPITGVKAGDQTTVAQQQFLAQACLHTDQAIIAFCGPPPIVPVIGPPGGVILNPVPLLSNSDKGGIIAAAVILLLCFCRRRWFFFEESKKEDEESESAGAQDLSISEEAEVPEDMEGGDMDDADANKLASRAKTEEEDMEMGGTTYSRTVQEPEYEDEYPDQRPKIIPQYELPEEPEDPFKLRHVEKPPPPPEEEDPYSLEHYVPDGGVVSYEREGEWSYEADGGYTPEEREAKKKAEWERKKYEREVQETPDAADNRRQRHLDAYDGGAIFDQLEEEVAVAGATADDMFDWVIRETLNTLDVNALDLEASTTDED